MRVGLTGGIGSGKSEVARVLAQCGAFIIDADVSAREVVAPGTPAAKEIAAHWPAVVDVEGVIDRSALGTIVFGDDEALQALNAIVHPAVRARGRELEATARPGQLIVHVVPLLFEAGFAAECDRSIVVIAPKERRLEWIAGRDKLERAAIEARMVRQIDPEEARLLADDVIENTGDKAQLALQARALYARLA